MIQLYYSPGACSQACHVMLKETDTPFELIKVDFSTHKTEDGRDYFDINPKGQVPALKTEEGDILTENIAICMYIAELKNDGRAIPKSGIARYRVLEAFSYVSSELHKTVTATAFMPDDAKPAQREKIAKKYEYINKKLEGQEYFTGNTFTAADAYLFVATNWCSYPAVNFDLSPFKNVQQFQKRVAALPNVQLALKEEGLLK